MQRQTLREKKMHEIEIYGSRRDVEVRFMGRVGARFSKQNDEIVEEANSFVEG
jgi:hypothetical protein